MGNGGAVRWQGKQRGRRVHRQEWRSFLLVHGEGDADHRQVVAEGLRGNQPGEDSGTDDDGVWAQRRVESPGFCRWLYVCSRRQGDSLCVVEEVNQLPRGPALKGWTTRQKNLYLGVAFNLSALPSRSTVISNSSP